MSRKTRQPAVTNLDRGLRRFQKGSLQGYQGLLAEAAASPWGRRKWSKPAWWNLPALIRFNSAEAGSRYKEDDVKYTPGTGFRISIGSIGAWLAINLVMILHHYTAAGPSWTSITTSFFYNCLYASLIIAANLWVYLLSKRDILWDRAVHQRERLARRSDEEVILDHVRGLVSSARDEVTGEGSELKSAEDEVAACLGRLYQHEARLDVIITRYDRTHAKPHDAAAKAAFQEALDMIRNRISYLRETQNNVRRQIARLNACFDQYAEEMAGSFSTMAAVADAQRECGLALEAAAHAEAAVEMSISRAIEQVTAIRPQLEQAARGLVAKMAETTVGDVAGDLNVLDQAIGQLTDGVEQSTALAKRLRAPAAATGAEIAADEVVEETVPARFTGL